MTPATVPTDLSLNSLLLHLLSHERTPCYTVQCMPVTPLSTIVLTNNLLNIFFESYKNNVSLFVSLFSVETQCYDAFNYARREEALTLLKQVKDPRTVKSKDDFTLLHFAAYHGWLDVVKEMITEHQFNPECEDKNGNTPLSKARSNGKQTVVDYLEKFIGTFVVYIVVFIHLVYNFDGIIIYSLCHSISSKAIVCTRIIKNHIIEIPTIIITLLQLQYSKCYWTSARIDSYTFLYVCIILALLHFR